MIMFLFKLLINIIIFFIGLTQFGEARRDVMREMPKWFCYITKTVSYATILFSFTVWFW